MKKRKLAFLAVAIIAVALLLETGILKYVNDRSTYQMAKVLLDRVVTVLNKNDESENELIGSLKDDYIVRAKAVSYIIDAKPEVERDVEELQKIADLMAVDEIHLFDENGYIYSGSVPKYFGYNFDSGEQMAYFKPMLTDKSLTMCQDVTPNTSEALPFIVPLAPFLPPWRKACRLQNITSAALRSSHCLLLSDVFRPPRPHTHNPGSVFSTEKPRTGARSEEQASAFPPGAFLLSAF